MYYFRKKIHKKKFRINVKFVKKYAKYIIKQKGNNYATNCNATCYLKLKKIKKFFKIKFIL